MYKELQLIARKTLKLTLAECSPAQQMIFKRMYSPNNLDCSINIIIDTMPSERLGWALEQVANTIRKNGKTELDFLSRQDIVTS